MDASLASGFFDIILGLFIQAKMVASDRLVGRFSIRFEVLLATEYLPVLDEAHKVCRLYTMEGSFTRRRPST
jgi:hypothetical protein